VQEGALLPNFVIVGTMKGGTTSLYHYLRQHPEVFMPEAKELHFFVAEKNLSRGLDWYERNFAGAEGAVAVGEASPDYTRYPEHDGVPKRMAEVLPDTRLIYVLRDPVERIRSHYLHDLARGRERRPIEEAVPGNPHYVDPSRYALQIEQYLEHFSSEQLLLLRSEDLRADRAATLRRVHEFLGVDPGWTAPEQEQEFNASSAKAAPNPLMRAARRVPGASTLRRLAPKPVIAAERLLGRSRTPLDADAAALTDELRERLVAELAEDQARLRGYLPAGFRAWPLG
jgi:Sulfotransferase domain